MPGDRESRDDHTLHVAVLVEDVTDGMLESFKRSIPNELIEVETSFGTIVGEVTEVVDER